MCKPHWYSVPQRIRDAVWCEYRPGQETDKKPSARYLAVQRTAVAYAAFKQDDPHAAGIVAVYIAEALRWQKRAIAAGLGDPLTGLLPA